MSLTWRERFVLVSPFAAMGILAIVPAIDDGPTVCPFALTTGMACPGCGMTRAASHLLRGDLSSAVSLHPLVPAIALLALGGWIWFVLRKTGIARPISSRLLNVILIAVFVALMAVWAARLTAGTLPPV